MRTRGLILVAVLAAPLPGAATGPETLFTELGGLPVITAVARTAGASFRSDPRTMQYFDNINGDWLRPRLIAFLCHIADGPCVYPGRGMAAAHKGLHIDAAAFRAFMEDFQAAMRTVGVPPRLQDRLLQRMSLLEPAIVTR